MTVEYMYDRRTDRGGAGIHLLASTSCCTITTFYSSNHRHTWRGGIGKHRITRLGLVSNERRRPRGKRRPRVICHASPPSIQTASGRTATLLCDSCLLGSETAAVSESEKENVLFDRTVLKSIRPAEREREAGSDGVLWVAAPRRLATRPGGGKVGGFFFLCGRKLSLLFLW